MKSTKRRRPSGHRRSDALPPAGGEAAEPLDVSWHDEEIRAVMLWGERTDDEGGDGVEPESVEEE